MPSATLILSPDAADHAPLIATLKDKTGVAIPNTPVNVTLTGDGSLSATPGTTPETIGRTMLFQTTDQSGTVQFIWRHGATDEGSRIYASAARGDSLTIRQLSRATR